MNREQDKIDELDRLIDDALHSEPSVKIPDNFTDRFISRVQQRVLWREVISEFSVKITVVAASLLVFAAIFYFVAVEDSGRVISFLSERWMAITSISIVLVFTFFADQVFLRYFLKKRQE